VFHLWLSYFPSNRYVTIDRGGSGSKTQTACHVAQQKLANLVVSANI
jgi:hypothetical protein